MSKHQQENSSRLTFESWFWISVFWARGKEAAPGCAAAAEGNESMAQGEVARASSVL